MPTFLNQAQIDAFWRDGCIFPIRVMSESAAADLRARLEAFEQETGGREKAAEIVCLRGGSCNDVPVIGA